MAVTSVAPLRRCPTSPESVPHFSGIRIAIHHFRLHSKNRMLAGVPRQACPAGERDWQAFWYKASYSRTIRSSG